MEVINRRGGLPRFRKAIENGRLRLGFIGGSITEFAEYRGWTESFVGGLMQLIPDVAISVRNAGVGGTGSSYGAFRVQRDIISKNCDLVFVEFAVNDRGMEKEYRMRCREGLIRKLIKADCDVVIVYTYCKEMYEPMMKGEVPDTIAEYEELAKHYGLSSVWMGKYAFDEYRAGLMRFEEWLPDGLHPQERGSYSYGQSVLKFIEPEIKSDAPRAPFSGPLKEDNWENCEMIPFDLIKWQKPWRLRDNSRFHIKNEYLDTSAAGASLKFDFDGTGISLVLMKGVMAACFKYRIDGGEWIDEPGGSAVEMWQGNNDWFKFMTLCEGLENTKHTFEIEVGANPKGSRCCIEMIGVLK